MDKALVVLSGGQDSTTCLFWAMQRYGDVAAIGFDYGQRHAAELQCAREICQKHGVQYDVIKTPLINQLTENALTRTQIKVQNESKDGLPNTFVEGRNLLFLTYAAIYAKTRGIARIVTGVGETDFSGYPDCRDVFIKSLNVTLNLAMDYQFIIETPLMWLNKAQIWRLADKLGVLEIVRDQTLTCYNGIIGAGCGNCPACTLRQDGYQQYLQQNLNINSNINSNVNSK